jgi:hypothetical protein
MVGTNPTPGRGAYNWRMSAKYAIAELGKQKICPKCGNPCPWTLVSAI